ncbi:GDSL-type esterase/lipase family protein [Alienimonas sp. DA493]|uniref:GDSL-type esterase/lipase family protein n=1 Tax=Alienimonas sp. DA493 TaxID=3373605 RepID=UPI0037547E60
MPALIALACSALACGFADDAAPEPLLKPGDRVALVGGSFWEGERRGGELEAALTLAVPDVTFRHLGWAGDMADQSARRFFKTAEEGREHLLEHVDLVDPTVIFVAYGSAESLPGGMNVADFKSHLASLLVELKKRTPRVVVLSPMPELGPDRRERNADLARYGEAAARVAAEADVPFVDVFWTLEPVADTLTRPADARLALAVAATDRLAWAGKTPEARRAGLLVTPPPASAGNAAAPREDVGRLLELVRAKNDLFFQRHRPQNETYLRGFRAHEQGNNAVEIEQFEPLVAAKDAEIRALRDDIVKAETE